MDWDVDGFLTNDYVGFVAAIHDYHGLIVVFQEGVVFAFSQGKGKTTGLAETVGAIKGLYKFTKNKGTGEVTGKRVNSPDDYEEYTVLMEGGIPIDENIEFFGLTPDDVADMEKRVDDLSPYFEETFQEM